MAKTTPPVVKEPAKPVEPVAPPPEPVPEPIPPPPPAPPAWEPPEGCLVRPASGLLIKVDGVRYEHVSEAPNGDWVYRRS